jgi:ribosomal protein L37AE/L43A
MTCRFVSTTEPRVVAGRHQTLCACDKRELGCLPCPETHCVVCAKEHAKAACTGCLDAARSDLEAIATLCASLPEEAVEKGVQSEAMVLLGPSSDPEAWRNRATSAMVGRLDASYLEDCRDEMHPLWILGTWEQIWRDFLDHQTENPVAWGSSYTYLNTQIGYMAEQVEPPFDEFARELRGCRAHLENVLRDGIREERSQTPCVDCETRLVKVFAEKEPEDHWVCPKCRRTYSGEEYARAQHFHMEDERADRFMKVSEALGMIDRPEQTLRTWMANGKVKRSEDPKTGAILVWWPDIRDLHRDTPSRKRRTA